MKSVKFYLLLAVLALSAGSVQATAVVKSKSNICNNITIDCVSCNPHAVTTQPATADRTGHIVVQVPNAGTYKITAADGQKKGQLLETVTATKAGKVTLSVKLALPAAE